MSSAVSVMISEHRAVTDLPFSGLHQDRTSSGSGSLRKEYMPRRNGDARAETYEMREATFTYDLNWPRI